jgi:RNA polymerase sigma-70 factor (ECF subfamily)
MTGDFAAWPVPLPFRARRRTRRCEDAIVTTTVLARARAGGREAFRERTGPRRRELQLRCYRIPGSVQDAGDTPPETLLAAWRGPGRFEERAPMRSWLYKIAASRCLNTLRGTGRRPAAAARSPCTAPARARPPGRAAVAAALPGRAAR